MKHVEFAHGMVMDTTSYTVMCCSKMKSEAGGLYQRKNTKWGKER